ncbi:unnamed protein product [Soboliphyme baturini]|uniref:AH domain-containing protein n=1 Tax=Soboliphyme baturini TaxID=241478 RepID=A0A183IZT4_9BILA|nr:unnamed protein product [Soboliphyme baturini]
MMDNVGRLMRRSASRLIRQDESDYNLTVVLEEWQLLTRAVKHCASLQRRASESVLKWSMNEESRAIRDVAFQFNDLFQLWSDAQATYDSSLQASIGQLEKIFSCIGAIHEAKKQLEQAIDKEQKLR